MYAVVVVIHVLVAFFLIIVILLQGGRGGLGETLGGAGAQSLFGGGANVVMSRVTAGVASVFMATCLSLAVLSTARGRSVVERFPATGSPLPLPLPSGEPVVPAPTLPEPPAAAAPKPAAHQPAASNAPAVPNAPPGPDAPAPSAPSGGTAP